MLNSGIEATSKLAPSLKKVRTISGRGFALTAKYTWTRGRYFLNSL